MTSDKMGDEEMVSLLRQNGGDPRAAWIDQRERAAAGGFENQNSSRSLRDSNNNLYDSDGEEEDHFGTVDWSYERVRGRVRASTLQSSIQSRPAPLRALYWLYDASQGWIVLSMVGITSGVVASIVDIGTDWATDVKFGYCNRGWWISRGVCCSDSSDMAGCPEWKAWVGFDIGAMCAYTFAGTCMAAFAAWLTCTFAPYAGGSGIPEIKVILGGTNIRKFLSAWTLVIKAIGLVLSVGSGLSIGKEGPMIHVCTCIGNVWCRLFTKYRFNANLKREVLSCAAGSGMAVAFGAPIGGVLFSLEEASSYFPPKTMWRAFYCAIAAVMTIQWLHRYPGNGKLVLFEVHYHHQWKFFEMPVFALLGALGGLIGAIFIRLNLAMTKLRRTTRLREHPVIEAMCLGFISCVLNWQFATLRGSSTGLLAALFSECGSNTEHVRASLCPADMSATHGIIKSLVLATFVKLLLTVCTATAKLPGGTLVPSLAIGALIGRAVGLAMERLQMAYGEQGMFVDCGRVTQCITPGVYAMVGAAAVLGGVTRMTVSLVVIMFELTGGLEYMLPVMVAVTVSKWAGDACGKEGMYDEMVTLLGYPFLDTKAEVPHSQLTAEDVMTPTPLDVVTIDGNTIASIETLLKCSRFRGFPVVTTMQHMLVVGYVTRRALQRMVKEAQADATAAADSQLDLGPFMDTAPLQISPTTPLDRIWEMFSLLGLRYVVVSRRGSLVGIMKKKDLLDQQQRQR